MKTGGYIFFPLKNFLMIETHAFGGCRFIRKQYVIYLLRGNGVIKHNLQYKTLDITYRKETKNNFVMSREFIIQKEQTS